MFNRPIPQPSTQPSAAHLVAILSSDQLLNEKKRPELITELAQLSEFSPSLFDTLCRRLIHNIANRCQRLPESTLYFNQLGGFLDHSIQRTHAAMSLFRQYLVAHPDTPLSSEQQQWWYALFSASLLKHIGRLCLDYKVDRYNVKSQFIKQWQPLLESLGQVSQQYLAEFSTHNDLTYRHQLTLILARSLMPESGYEWLVSHPEIFPVWLALLVEDDVRAGALSAILDRADAIVIQDELMNMPLHLLTPRSERRAAVSSFIDHTPDPHHEKEKLAALEFMRWLEQALERGKFLLNKAPILSVPGGLLILPEAFMLFCKEHGHYKNWQSIRQSMMALPLYPMDQRQAHLAQHEQHSGLLIPGQLFIPETIYHQPSGATAPQQTTATQLALAEYPQRLSTQGVWAEPAIAARIQPVAPHG